MILFRQDGKFTSASEVKVNNYSSQITGHYFTPTQSGATGITQSATNKKLISEITEMFSNVDSKDENSVQAAFAKYKELVKPAYTAYGISDGTKILNNDTADFRKQISNILLAANYHTTDYRI